MSVGRAGRPYAGAMTPHVSPKRGRLPFAGGSAPPLVLEIDLSRGLATTPPTDPIGALRARNTPSLTEVLAGLRLGATDDRVAGAIVNVADTITITQAEELGTALERLSVAGKPTVAIAASFGELGTGTIPYYLALHADSIWLQPSGAVGLTGVALEVTTVRGVLDKIGAEPQIGQRHEYKSAGEALMSTEVSGPNREMTERIAQSVLERVAAVAARRREVSAERFAAATDASPIGASDAFQLGLVDHLGYRDEAYADARRAWGTDGEVQLQYAHRYARHRGSRPAERLRRRRQPRIGVVTVDGGIATGRSSGTPFARRTAGSETVCAALRQAQDDESLRAVILRVDSPGGSYVASDAIRHAVHRFRASGRPIIASMGGVAASGGYFVAMPCNAIVALPSTLTGSIGVLGGKVAIGRTYERLGITREAVGAGTNATMFSSALPFDDAQWAKVDAWLDTVYADFTEKAAADRGLTLDRLEPLARGRVWTGADASEHGLVDSLGGLRTAIELACTRLNLDPDRTSVVPIPHVSPLQRLVPAESSNSAADAVASGPEGMLAALARATGLEVPGALSLPWRLRVT